MIVYSEQTFEGIKHINENGQEYWMARELQTVLEYTSWRRFADAIDRAKLACKNSGYDPEDHFAGVGKMVGDSSKHLTMQFRTRIHSHERILMPGGGLNRLLLPIRQENMSIS